MIFIDSNIFMYAAGKESAHKEASQQFLLRMMTEDQKNLFCTSAEVLQEILYRYSAINALQYGLQVFDVICSLGLKIFPVRFEDALYARTVLENYPKLSPRDAVHLGVMHGQKMDQIVTYDREFSKISGIRRLEPTDFLE